jgi:hypothetical protein
MANSEIVYSGTFELWDYIRQSTVSRYWTVAQYLNLLAVALTIVAIVFRKKLVKNNSENNVTIYLIIFLVILFYMTSIFFPWLKMPHIMLMIQFAWRLEVFIVFVMSLLSGLALRNIKSKKVKIISLVLIIIFNMITVSYTYIDKKFEEFNLDNVHASYGMGWQMEYLPMQSHENLNYLLERNQDVILIVGDANVKIEEDDMPNLKFSVNSLKDYAKIELPRIYYLGYELTKDKEKVPVYINENGLLEAEIWANGEYELKYKGTLLGNIANGMSITLLSGISIYEIVKYSKKRKKG